MSDQKFILLTQSQGSHSVNMHKPWIEYSTAATEIFDIANEVLFSFLGNRYLTDLLCEEESLKEPSVQQLGIITTTVACYKALIEKEIVKEENIVAVGGFSLAEISALVISESIPFQQALHFVSERSDALKYASSLADGGLCMAIGCDETIVQTLIDQTKGDDVLMVMNGVDKKVFGLCGHLTAIERFMEQGKKVQGLITARHNMPALHTPLMEPARDRLKRAIQKLTPSQPKFPVCSSCNAQLFSDDNIKYLLEHQLTNRLHWDRCVSQLRQLSIAHNARIIELAPGQMHMNNGKHMKPELKIESATAVSLNGFQ